MTKYKTLPNNELEIVPLENPISKDVVTMACGLPYCMFPDLNSSQPVVVAMSKALLSISGDRRPTIEKKLGLWLRCLYLNPEPDSFMVLAVK